jgi:hypothetical protein
LVANHTNMIVSSSWDAVISRWSWETISTFINEEGLCIVHYDYILKRVKQYVDAGDFSLILTHTEHFLYKEPRASDPLFIGVFYILIPDELHRLQIDALRKVLREHRAREYYDIKKGPNYIIATSWKVVMDHWPWPEMNKCRENEGLTIVDTSWVWDSIRMGKRLPPEDYSLWEGLLPTIWCERQIRECHGHGFKWQVDPNSLDKPLCALKPPSPAKYPKGRRHHA